MTKRQQKPLDRETAEALAWLFGLKLPERSAEAQQGRNHASPKPGRDQK
jgi:hypothetical protein